MVGVLLVSLAMLFSEMSSVIGKANVAARKQSIYAMGFLQVFWVLFGFGLIAFFKNGSFVFNWASLPTLSINLILNTVQAHVTVLAIVYAARSTFGFVRVVTVPLILIVDILLGYHIGAYQLIGIVIIMVVLAVLFFNHGIERKGAGYVLFTAINAVASISIYKYNITHFNSVVAEQLITNFVIAVYFGVGAFWMTKENPFKFLRRPLYFFQSVTQGASAGIESFAYIFAPASVIIAAKRAATVLWSIAGGTLYFKEQGLARKIIGFLALTVGLVLLALS